MSELNDFLSELAVDPRRLGEFLLDPEKAISAAELTDEDRVALVSGMPGIVAARLAGVSIEDAFVLRPLQLPQQFVAPQFVLPPPQFVAPQFVVPPPQFVAPQFVAPQFVVPPPPEPVVSPDVEPVPRRAARSRTSRRG